MGESLKSKSNVIGKRVVVEALCLVVTLVSSISYREQAFGENRLQN